MPKPLTPQERKFVSAYRKRKDAELAYRIAYPAADEPGEGHNRSKRTIAERADRLLGQPRIQDAVMHGLDPADTPATRAKAEDPDAPLVDLDELTDADDLEFIRRTLREIVREPDHKDRFRAMELQKKLIEETDQSDADAQLLRALGPESSAKLHRLMRERWPELA